MTFGDQFLACFLGMVSIRCTVWITHGAIRVMDVIAGFWELSKEKKCR